MLVAVPHSTVAQTCTSTPAISETSATVTLTGQYTAMVQCEDLTNGLTLTLDPGVVIGVSAETRATGTTTDAAGTGKGALNIDANGDGNKNIDVTSSGSIYSSHVGILIRDNGSGAVKLTHQAGTVDATEEGISIIAHGSGGVTVELGESSVVKSESIGLYLDATVGSNAVMVTHRGKLTVKQMGLFVAGGTGSVSVKTEAGSSIEAKGASDKTATSGINASVRGTSTAGNVAVTHKGMISTDGNGIFAFIQGPSPFGSSTTRDAGSTGTITVETVAGSKVTAAKNGILLWHNGGGSQAGQGTFTMTLRGRVMGGNTGADNIKYAGVHVQALSAQTNTKGNGGTIVIGPRAHLSAESKVAIKVDDKVGDVEIMLEKEDGVVGRVQGQILNPGSDDTKAKLTFKTRTGESGSGDELKEDGTVLMRGDPKDSKGVYDVVNTVVLKTITGGYEFKTKEGTSAQRLYQDRARLYEVLPSMLAGLVELSPYSVRMAAPRLTGGEAVVVESTRGERVAAPHSDMGVWVRLAASEGDRRADAATTSTGIRAQSLSWDVKRTALEAGLDLPTDDDLVLGVSAHYRQSKATVKMGGTMEATGVGLGVSATWTDDRGLYVDGQLAYTRFSDIEVRSNSNGRITSGGGTGLAVGVEVGQPMSWANMTVTPRGGLSWSSVDMDAFAEPDALPGAGTVAPDDGQSVQARVGVLAELGPADADTRLYASLDVEHEFSPELDVMAAGTKLTAKVKPTWVRLGVGGAMPLGGTDATMLVGDAFYATAGSGNADFGGGVALNIRF